MKRLIIAATLAVTGAAYAETQACTQYNDVVKFYEENKFTTERWQYYDGNRNFYTKDQELAKTSKLCELSKKSGVRIGMTAKAVLEKSSWGEPKGVNKTSTRYGTEEQWVYGDGNYLYFKNGKLTAIQN